MRSEMSEFAMQSNGCCFVSCRSFFAGFEEAEIVHFPIGLDKCSPAIAIGAFMHSFYTAFVVFISTFITKILPWSSFANRFPSQIACFAVAVINVIRRKIAGHNQPYYSMCQIHSPIYAYNPVPIVSLMPCYTVFSLPATSTIYFPAKFSGSFIVAKQRFDINGRQIWVVRFAHRILQGGDS
jgi:hypothetical protein